MRKYEIMFIVRPDLEENAVKETVKKLEKVLTDNKAVITLSKELGQKEFAYEIKGFKSGFYYLYNIDSSEQKAIKEFIQYTQKYDLQNEHIKGNQKHSLRVMEILI